MGLVLIEPDLGTALFVAGSGVLALFYGGWPIRNFLVGVGAAVPAVVFAITLHSYRLRRITDYFSVWTDLPNSDAWQLKQSLLSLGHGSVCSGRLARRSVGRGAVGYTPLAALPLAFIESGNAPLQSRLTPK